jgi:hypothetical protein
MKNLNLPGQLPPTETDWWALGHASCHAALTKSNTPVGSLDTSSRRSTRRRWVNTRWRRRFLAYWDTRLAISGPPLYAESDGGFDCSNSPPEHRRDSCLRRTTPARSRNRATACQMIKINELWVRICTLEWMVWSPVRIGAEFEPSFTDTGDHRRRGNLQIRSIEDASVRFLVLGCSTHLGEAPELLSVARRCFNRRR